MSYLWGRYISEEGLENIKGHKYVAGEYSWTDKKLNHFWVFAVEFLPKTMAPNTVTLLGLVALLGAYGCMLANDLSMTQLLPRWTYLAMAIGVFAFQTLDAMDGKQARRTNSSTPLGQLFDHGLDGISWSVNGLNIVSLLSLGLTLNSAIAMFQFWMPLYITTLLEYHTGVFEYNIGNIDGTTGLLILIGFDLAPAIFGVTFYNWQLKDVFWFLPEIITGSFTMRSIMIAILLYTGVIFSVVLLVTLFTRVKDTKARLSWIFELAQHSLNYVILFSFNTEIKFVRDNLGLFMIALLLIYCIMLTKLIVWVMSKMKMSWIHWEYVCFLIYFYFQSKYDGSEESETNLKYAFFATFALLTLLYTRLFQSCISQITNYLGIYCFSIEKVDKKKD